ncbi:ribonuclease D [Cutibacterium sp. WCA-380-WT-3A]|uniref:Ribonuclease D n=1 Tax=Cutibacterium porci TaxID=2605781 RepID=A0A7K0J6M2_9ACTN|nr:HRDC domain-containing protein [Cutibacterium porci]MSS45589.1 ribonuclease D [Cutibacterium porci]
MNDVPILAEPREGVPPVVNSREGLIRTCQALRHGHGPVAIDTERAHGFRYSPRACLIQLRREGSGTHLVDPLALGGAIGLKPLADALAGTQWILHAAPQDMPCLAMDDLRPSDLFDTELAGRLLNLPRVGLGPMVERYCGVTLLKEHSASDWSRRPIPHDWLVYAALDVELLNDLKDKTLEDLRNTGKLEWARQEFAHLVEVAAGLPSEEPGVNPKRWRRISHIGDIRSRAGLQLAHDLWLARENLAHDLDIAPGRVLRDDVLIAAARRCDRTVNVDANTILAMKGFRHREAKKHRSTWVDAINHARGVSPQQYPPLREPSSAIPHPRSWQHHHPKQAARWSAVRPAVNDVAAQYDVPPENLCTPAWLRQFAWQPPEDCSVQGVDAFLADLGARPWQREILSDVLSTTAL